MNTGSLPSIRERNRQILQVRHEGVPRTEVALRFNLSPTRIQQIEKRDSADRYLAARRAELREEIRNADDPERQHYGGTIGATPGRPSVRAPSRRQRDVADFDPAGWEVEPGFGAVAAGFVEVAALVQPAGAAGGGAVQG